MEPRLSFEEDELEGAAEDALALQDIIQLTPSKTQQLRAFVKQAGGQHVISKVLIANNGMAAVKAIRSIRKWAYETFGNERMISFVAMVTPDDLKVNAEYIRMADEYVQVPSGTPNNNYANTDLIVELAEQCRVDAVWVGWGFASENPILPEKLTELSNRINRTILFIGPPPQAMRALGDKIASTIVAQSANVPTIGWSGDDVVIPSGDFLNGTHNGQNQSTKQRVFVTVPDDIYRSACVETLEQGLRAATKIGFPVMVKASEGGGGKGIRLVRESSAFEQAFLQVQREVPGSPIFVMKLLENARHLEVQVIADKYGNAIALFGRDCSIQRRHQKIIEEGPVTIAPPHIQEAMEGAAIRLAKLVGYVSAGTVEYLYDPATQKYYFLELNPRLQVEHPVTEMISGVNIPAAQLQIAMGIPLSRIRDIRMLYGLSAGETTDIDFDFSKQESALIQRRPSPKGHVIAARVTAENPDAGFQPNSGRVYELNFRSNSHVWGYFSVSSSGGIHQYADSQFGHLFSYGMSREESRRNMIMALKELSIRGDFRTPIEYLVKILETSDFIENRVHTGWLDARIASNPLTERPDTMVSVLCGSVIKGLHKFEHNVIEFKKQLERGQVPDKALLMVTCPVDFIYDGIHYKATVAMSGPNKFRVSCNKSHVELEARRLADGSALMLLDGKSHVVYCNSSQTDLDDVPSLELEIDGKICVLEKENDPTQLRSPSPGKLIRYLVDTNTDISAGTAFAEIEVMKMIMPLVATVSGTLLHVKQPGVVLNARDLIAIVRLKDPSSIRKTPVFQETLPSFGPPTSIGSKPHQQFRHVYQEIQSLLRGYDNVYSATHNLRPLLEVLRTPSLPFYELAETLSAISSRIPAPLYQKIRKIVDVHVKNGGNSTVHTEVVTSEEKFNATQVLELLDQTRLNLESSGSARNAVDEYDSYVAPIQELCRRYENGLKWHERTVLVSLLQNFIAVEKQFETVRYEDTIMKLRDANKGHFDVVMEMARAHSQLRMREEFLIQLLDQARSDNDGSEQWKDAFLGVLEQLASLSNPTKAAQKARELLLYRRIPTVTSQHASIAGVLNASVAASSQKGELIIDVAALDPLVNASYALLDVLPGFLLHKERAIRMAAMYTYVKHAFREYDITRITHGQLPDSTVDYVKWNYHTNSDIAQQELYYKNNIGKSISRTGIMIPIVNASKSIAASIDAVLSNGADLSNNHDAITLNIVMDLEVLQGLVHENDDQTAANIRSRLITDLLHGASATALTRLERITAVIVRNENTPLYYSYRSEFLTEDHERSNGEHILNLVEDKLLRHIEPAFGHRLELDRLHNFDIEPVFITRRLHVYSACAKSNPADTRFFARSFIFGIDLAEGKDIDITEYLRSEGHRSMTDIMDALEAVGRNGSADCNHIYMCFVPLIQATVRTAEEAILDFVRVHGIRLFKLRVTHAEIRFYLTDPSVGTEPVAYRFMISNVSGYVTHVDIYTETRDTTTGLLKLNALHGRRENTGSPLLNSSPNVGSPVHDHGRKYEYDGMPAHFAYSTKESIQPKRYRAHLMGTTYVYDIPDLFRSALEEIWAHFVASVPEGHTIRVPSHDYILEYQELILSPKDESAIVPTERSPGLNNIGMVAWQMKLRTPEYPQGRDIIVISNDITFYSGSFGPKEDKLFFEVSKFARMQGIPRVYIAANSGARIGLAEEITTRFKAAWTDQCYPERGIDYLYLDESDYDELVRLVQKGGQQSVFTEQIIVDGAKRYKIQAIVGKDDGLGVENLKGSGLIAGETSRAYDDIFTISLVTCRSVGIGAYLVRLGQRTIQVRYQPLILTGAGALNKVLGRPVYMSNLQLGGTQIMHTNGVSHMIAENDFHGFVGILKWLSYVPSMRDAALPRILVLADPVDREVGTPTPTQSNVDPRLSLAGHKSDISGDYVSGFFDRNTFFETLEGWAKGVIVARARLGGIPVGVIAVETRATKTVIPADPAVVDSTEQCMTEASQVWYPNSAYKTAQAIRDFNNGEQLPLFIFANWRGFSGGQNDMFREILKYGSMIVDALKEYRQPVFIYIVGELRGGAWVVLDPSINPHVMEMYAESNARGNVLEAEGTVEIKFRKHTRSAAMARLDPEYRRIKTQLESLAISSKIDSTEELTKENREAASSSSEIDQLQKMLETRENQLSSVFHQIGFTLADLHDRPERMKAKNVIREIVPWSQSRKYFFYRLDRRLAEDRVEKKWVLKGKGLLNREVIHGVIVDTFNEYINTANVPRPTNDTEEDKMFVEWIEKNQNLVDGILAAKLKSAITDILQGLDTSNGNVATQSVKR